MSDERSLFLKIMRRAQRAFNSPAEAEALRAEGISIGEAKQISADELLEALANEPEDAEPCVIVTVYTGMRPAEDRAAIEDPICEHVEHAGIGTWTGGGEGSIGDDHFFDIIFSVTDLVLAEREIRSFISANSPHLRVEITSRELT